MILEETHNHIWFFWNVIWFEKLGHAHLSHQIASLVLYFPDISPRGQYVCGGSDGTMTMTRGKKELINLLLLMMLVFFSSFYNSLHSHWKMSWWGCCIMCTRATHRYLECAVQPKQNWMKMTYQPIVGPFEYTMVSFKQTWTAGLKSIQMRRVKFISFA